MANVSCMPVVTAFPFGIAGGRAASVPGRAVGLEEQANEEARWRSENEKLVDTHVTIFLSSGARTQSAPP